jgi:hypothetical protein
VHALGPLPLQPGPALSPSATQPRRTRLSPRAGLSGKCGRAGGRFSALLRAHCARADVRRAMRAYRPRRGLSAGRHCGRSTPRGQCDRQAGTGAACSSSAADGQTGGLDSAPRPPE